MLDEFCVVLIPVEEATAFDLGTIGEVTMIESPLPEGFVVGELVGVGFCHILRDDRYRK